MLNQSITWADLLLLLQGAIEDEAAGADFKQALLDRVLLETRSGPQDGSRSSKAPKSVRV